MENIEEGKAATYTGTRYAKRTGCWVTITALLPDGKAEIAFWQEDNKRKVVPLSDLRAVGNPVPLSYDTNQLRKVRISKDGRYNVGGIYIDAPRITADAAIEHAERYLALAHYLKTVKEPKLNSIAWDHFKKVYASCDWHQKHTVNHIFDLQERLEAKS